MTVKEHYDNHLGKFYSWLTGDFERNKNIFQTFCTENDIIPVRSKCAIDLGAGHGVQSLALAALGFEVTAIDFNEQLIGELKLKIDSYQVSVVNEDIRAVSKYSTLQPELIVCCGDTLTHLESVAEICQLLQDCYHALCTNGKIILSFRDYSAELEDTQRFIPVKSDTQRILTCFLEYFPDRVRVTDLLYELQNGTWVQEVSSYYKTRISRNAVVGYLRAAGFKVILDKEINRMITIIGQR